MERWSPLGTFTTKKRLKDLVGASTLLLMLVDGEPSRVYCKDLRTDEEKYADLKERGNVYKAKIVKRAQETSNPCACRILRETYQSL